MSSQLRCGHEAPYQRYVSFIQYCNNLLIWAGELGIYYEDLYDLVRPLHDVRKVHPSKHLHSKPVAPARTYGRAKGCSHDHCPSCSF